MLRIPAHLLTVMDDDRTLSVLAPKPVHARGTGAAAEIPEPAAPLAPAEPAATTGPGHTEPVGPAPAEPVGPASAEPVAPADVAPASAGEAREAREVEEPPAGLPSRRRRSRRTDSPETSTTRPQAVEEPTLRTPEQAGAAWAALQEGTLSGRKAPGPPAQAPSASPSDDLGDDET